MTMMVDEISRPSMLDCGEAAFTETANAAREVTFVPPQQGRSNTSRVRRLMGGGAG